MKKLYPILGLLLCVVAAFAQKDTVPSWLDTIPPKIEISPKKRFHSKPFYVSFSANENAQLWVGINSSKSMKAFKQGINISNPGKTILYYYGEDIYGNRSKIDSVAYVLDLQPPTLSIDPPSGVYRKPVVLRINTNEPCRLFRHRDPVGKERVKITDSTIITQRFVGYISAVDRAGNRTRSDSLFYMVDTTSIKIAIRPKPGIYNYPVKISLKPSQKAKVYYSFDPSMPTRMFTPYIRPVPCPHGLVLVRFFARNDYNSESVINQATYIIDTVPPRVRYNHREGIKADTLTLFTKENATILYTFDRRAKVEEWNTYSEPIVVPHKGKALIRAVAEDKAKNRSPLLVWERKYDRTPPTVSSSHLSGTYNRRFKLTFSASEPVTILYTQDGTKPDERAIVYRKGVIISKIGVTTIRYVAIDEADNRSEEKILEFFVDIDPPKVKAIIERSKTKENEFSVLLVSNEEARIYYEVGELEPTRSSPQFTKEITLRMNQELRYFAVDRAGNASDIVTMDDLQKPMVLVQPEGGVYNAAVPVMFTTNMAGEIYWRFASDSTFLRYHDTILLNEEGLHVLEYYSLSPTGFKSPLRRLQYLIDWTAPRATISVKKGVGDSVSIFFECSENASIYYTLDGTSPFFSNTTQIAGNKFTRSRDRISILRSGEAKLAFYAEDAAGNQGAISVLDVFKPRAVPTIPSSKKKIYNRILSLSFSTYDEKSQIYYEHNGKKPSLKSNIYTTPITLLTSDTIMAFVVDASGYRGEIDTFVYFIDLPPSPQFTLSPKGGSVGQSIQFDASATLDQESPLSSLEYHWDFNGDGKVDAKKKGTPTVHHSFHKAGKYIARLTVLDPKKQSSQFEKEVAVYGACPQNMVFVPRMGDSSFCIDTYEWPNKIKETPRIAVSWVRAKMYCYDQGKHLCSVEEWQYACSGKSLKDRKKYQAEQYPYGSQYDKERCPTEGDKMFRSGNFSECKEPYGTHDMIGNVWEWVIDPKNGKPKIIGGSYKYGEKARCGFFFTSSMMISSEDVGFRCCK